MLTPQYKQQFPLHSYPTPPSVHQWAAFGFVTRNVWKCSGTERWLCLTNSTFWKSTDAAWTCSRRADRVSRENLPHRAETPVTIWGLWRVVVFSEYWKGKKNMNRKKANKNQVCNIYRNLVTSLYFFSSKYCSANWIIPFVTLRTQNLSGMRPKGIAKTLTNNQSSCSSSTASTSVWTVFMSTSVSAVRDFGWLWCLGIALSQHPGVKSKTAIKLWEPLVPNHCTSGAALCPPGRPTGGGNFSSKVWILKKRLYCDSNWCEHRSQIEGYKEWVSHTLTGWTGLRDVC